MQQVHSYPHLSSQPYKGKVNIAEKRLKAKKYSKVFYEQKRGHLWLYGNIESMKANDCFQNLTHIIHNHFELHERLTLHLYNIQFNTSTVKQLMSFMNFIKNLGETDLVWHFDQSDLLMKEIVYDVASLFNFKLKICNIS